MSLPLLNDTSSVIETIDKFGGYDHSDNASSNEFFDMMNMSSDGYPTLSTRKKKKTYRNWGTHDSRIYGMASTGKNIYMLTDDVTGLTDWAHFFVYDALTGGYVYDTALTNSSYKTETQIVPMGNGVAFFPQKLFYTNGTSITKLEAATTKSPTDEHPTTATFRMCDKDGNQLTANIVVSATVPADHSKKYWLDTGDSNAPVLHEWSEAQNGWVIINSYLRISCTGAFIRFKEGDAITISGLSGFLDHFNTTVSIVKFVSDNYIVIRGIINAEHIDHTASITFERRTPNMDFVIESNNRLWGCRYGENEDGEIVNEIYASALGDPYNWHKFEGISTDSYAVSIGEDGAFTGAINYNGYPTFFKENCIIRIFGSYPAQYQVSVTKGFGVQEGCNGSLAVVGSTLYYKSRTGICAYDGSLPNNISAPFGGVDYINANGGALGNKYYVSMQEQNTGRYRLFVYDQKKYCWHIENDERAKFFCLAGDDLFYYRHNDDYSVSQVVSETGKHGSVLEGDFEWMAETGTITTDSPLMKYIGRIVIRLFQAIGARMDIYIDYDSADDWQYITTLSSDRTRSFSVPIRPKRCDHFSLRFVGVGETKIFSIAKFIEKGSDIS